MKLPIDQVYTSDREGVMAAYDKQMSGRVSGLSHRSLKHQSLTPFRFPGQGKGDCEYGVIENVADRILVLFVLLSQLSDYAHRIPVPYHASLAQIDRALLLGHI